MAPPEIPPGTAGQLHSRSKPGKKGGEPGFAALRRRHHRHGVTRHHQHPDRRPIQIAAGQDTLSVAVVSPDRWFPGDFAVLTSRDGHAFAGEVAGLDVCTGQVTIKLPGS